MVAAREVTLEAEREAHDRGFRRRRAADAERVSHPIRLAARPKQFVAAQADGRSGGQTGETAAAYHEVVDVRARRPSLRVAAARQAVGPRHSRGTDRRIAVDAEPAVQRVGLVRLVDAGIGLAVTVDVDQ
jgi:hypothetical protein